MRKFIVPIFVTLVTFVAMVNQALTPEVMLADAPTTRLGEIKGCESSPLKPGEAELNVLPKDTIIDKRSYIDEEGNAFQVSLIIGGRSKSSIHRPELCLPAQGFRMLAPRNLEVAGRPWHIIELAGKGVSRMAQAYTFFNQEGFRTAGHVPRILCDMWDRSVYNRIDRWVMVTVFSSTSDDRRIAAFLSRMEAEVLK